MSAETPSGSIDELRGSIRGRTLHVGELQDGSREIAPWMRDALCDFDARAGDDAFPCLFGRKAWKAGTVRFLFSDFASAPDYKGVAAGLSEYADFVRSVRIEDRLFAPLVVFVRTSPSRAESFHELGWDVLNGIHKLDPSPWPEAIPASPEAPEWCFCFAGIQLFVNMSTPDHRAFRSRNLGRFLTFVINPRENFDAVASVHTRSGRLVRGNIRSRVAAYNGGAVPDELGFYGEPENREWVQYQLSEPELPRPSTCPFRSIHAPRGGQELPVASISKNAPEEMQQ